MGSNFLHPKLKSLHCGDHQEERINVDLFPLLFTSWHTVKLVSLKTHLLGSFRLCDNALADVLNAFFHSENAG